MNPVEKNAGDNRWREGERASTAWAALVFGLIGATVTTAALFQLRRSVNWIYTETQSSCRNASGSSSRSCQEEAWRTYNRRMHAEHKEKMERVERIRRMQRIFNQEKKKYKSSYEKWRDYGPDAYQNFQQDDCYWNTNASYGDKRTNFGSHPWENGNFMMSHHYSVLGLDRLLKSIISYIKLPDLSDCQQNNIIIVNLQSLSPFKFFHIFELFLDLFHVLCRNKENYNIMNSIHLHWENEPFPQDN